MSRLRVSKCTGMLSQSSTVCATCGSYLYHTSPKEKGALAFGMQQMSVQEALVWPCAQAVLLSAHLVHFASAWLSRLFDSFTHDVCPWLSADI